jgi:flagellar protein FlaG
MGTISISPVKNDGPLRPKPATVNASSTNKERPNNEVNDVSKASEAAAAQEASKAAAAQEAAKAAVDMQELEDAVSDANKVMESMDRSLLFTVDEGTERIVVKVVDDSTGEIVRQIPPEEILRLKAHFKDMLESDQNMGSTPIMLSVKT